MRYVNELYKIKDKDIPSDLQEFKIIINERKKNEKKEYRIDVQQRESIYLSFGERNRNKIIIIIVILFCVIFGFLFFSFVNAKSNQSSLKNNDDSYVSSSSIKGEKELLESQNNSILDDEIVSQKDMKFDANDSTKSENEIVFTSKKEENCDKKFKVGDIVYFSGKLQYISSNSKEKGIKAEKGKARISKMKASGIHKYHLISLDNEDNLYGWVDEEYIK